MEKLDFIDSKFRLAILAAKRGKQLVAGAKKRVDTSAENPLTIAIEEIYKKKVKFRILEPYEHFKDEDATSLLMGNDDEAVEYENSIEDIFNRDDDDSEDFQSDDY